MMPDLGEYGTVVTSAYLGTIAMLAGMVIISILRARQSRKKLEDLERDRKN